MTVLVIAVFILFAIIFFCHHYLTRPWGYCTRCKKSLSLLMALSEAKLIEGQVVCGYCLNEPNKKPYTSQENIVQEKPSISFTDLKDVVKKAIAETRCLKIIHHGIERIVDPYWIDYTYLYTWCHLKNDARTFKLNGIEKCEILEETYAKNNEVLEYFNEKELSFGLNYKDWKVKCAIECQKDQIYNGKKLIPRASGEFFFDKYAEQAIKNRKRVWIKYLASNNELTERKVDIYYSQNGQIYGWCHLRNEARTFKINQIKEWKILDENFNWDKDLSAYLKERRDLGPNASPPSFQKWKDWGGKNW